MTFGSLFSGIGGIDLGFERAGMVCRWQVEIDPFCRQVLAKHWPRVRRYEDIRLLTGRELVAVDLIAGGDPCQENSKARQGNVGLEQPSLGGEFIRILNVLRPPFVLRENPAHVRRDAPWPWSRFRDELQRLGYAVLPFKARACCLGAEHRRERLFLLATLPDAMQARLSRDVIEEMARSLRESGAERQIQTFLHTSRQHWRKTEPVLHRAGDGVPDRVDRTKALGNAVVPAIAELIARVILQGRNYSEVEC